MSRSTTSYKTLADICIKITDGTHQTPVYKDEGVIFISAKNIKNGRLDFTEIKYISKTEHEFLTRNSKPEPGDLLLAKSGSLGDVALIPELDFEFSIFESLALIKPRQEIIDPRYLHQYLQSPYAESYFHSIKTGLAVKHLHIGDLRDLKIFVPPLPVQRELADRLIAWDTAIETTERLIAAKEVYIGAVTERIYRRSPGWSRYRLGDFLQETKVLHGHGDYVIGSVGKNGIKPRDEVYSKDLTSNHERNLLVKPGWLCFGLASDCMAFGVNSTNQTYSVSPAYRTFQINGADPRFFEGYLRVFNGRLSKRFLITSARQGKAIDFEGLFNTECYFPSREEQQQIASAALLMREELDHLRQLREALKRQKRGLMQKLLTGKWRIQMEEGVPV
ncbi:restriction endonuclease subunit S [Tepidiphilus sp. J10]|uniref:restriction endonuclease subunit S n=1 Tax=Tepidiphilus sp. J10 TaxID=2502185 RepID=UPI00115CC887|nr:restriction endonuclease subunit S [Tepidiphilus sp. J10]